MNLYLEFIYCMTDSLLGTRNVEINKTLNLHNEESYKRMVRAKGRL
jgi:hypothetical protein